MAHKNDSQIYRMSNSTGILRLYIVFTQSRTLWNIKICSKNNNKKKKQNITQNRSWLL